MAPRSLPRLPWSWDLDVGFDFGLQEEDAVAFCHCRSTCSADGSCNAMGKSICYGLTYRTQAWLRSDKENKRLRFKFFSYLQKPFSLRPDPIR